jgi:hypothetical protein
MTVGIQSLGAHGEKELVDSRTNGHYADVDSRSIDRGSGGGDRRVEVGESRHCDCATGLHCAARLHTTEK